MEIIGVTLGFCTAEVLRYGMDSLYSHPDSSLLTRHYFLDQHFPLNRETNVQQLLEVTVKHNMTWVDSQQDRGAAPGFNFLYRQLKPRDEDLIFGIDPDCTVPTSGWITAMRDVLAADPTLAWVSVMPTPHINQQIAANNLAGGEVKVIAGHNVFVPGVIDMIDCCMWRCSFLNHTGGLLQEYKYYGQVEIPMWNKARQLKMKYGYLMDWTADNNRGMHPPEYTQYKRDHIDHVFSGSFAEWLARRQTP